MLTNRHCVEDGAGNCHEEDGAEMVKEESVGHEVSGIKDDRGKHEKEEDVRCQRGGRFLTGQEQQETNDDTNLTKVYETWLNIKQQFKDCFAMPNTTSLCVRTQPHRTLSG